MLKLQDLPQPPANWQAMHHLDKEKERFDTYKYRNIVSIYGSKMWQAIVSNVFDSLGRTHYSYMRR